MNGTRRVLIKFLTSWKNGPFQVLSRYSTHLGSIAILYFASVCSNIRLICSQNVQPYKVGNLQPYKVGNLRPNMAANILQQKGWKICGHIWLHIFGGFAAIYGFRDGTGFHIWLQTSKSDLQCIRIN